MLKIFVVCQHYKKQEVFEASNVQSCTYNAVRLNYNCKYDFNNVLAGNVKKLLQAADMTRL